MSLSTELAHWSRGFFGVGNEARRTALDILRRRYVDEIEHAKRFKFHAGQMHYPQFRERLLQIAAQESAHAGRIAQKIIALGGTMPEVRRESESTKQSSWQSLLKDLDEEGHCAGELAEQIWAVQTDYPDIAALLERIAEDEKKHRDEIREMLMRSDAFADSLA